MNGGLGPLRKFHIGLAAAGVTAAALAGCADLRRAVTLPPVNPESPVAAQVRAAAPLRYDTPRLGDVPPVPKNVPTAPALKASVVAMVRCRRSVAGFAPAHPALSSGPEQFAASARDTAQVNPADVPPTDSATLSEGEAAQLRSYASPPAAIASGPAPTADEAKPGGPGPAPAPSRAPVHPHRAAAVPHSGPPPAAAPAAAPPSTSLQAGDTPAPLPPPGPDPLLSRCTT